MLDECDPVELKRIMKKIESGFDIALESVKEEASGSVMFGISADGHEIGDNRYHIDVGAGFTFVDIDDADDDDPSHRSYSVPIWEGEAVGVDFSCVESELDDLGLGLSYSDEYGSFY